RLHHITQVLGRAAHPSRSHFAGYQNQTAGVAADRVHQLFQVLLALSRLRRLGQQVAHKAYGAIAVEPPDPDYLIGERSWKRLASRENQARLAGRAKSGAKLQNLRLNRTSQNRFHVVDHQQSRVFGESPLQELASEFVFGSDAADKVRNKLAADREQDL